MLSRPRWQRPGYRRYAALIALVSGLGGCLWEMPSAEIDRRPTTPLPYRFQITALDDARDMAEEGMDYRPFDQEEFLFLMQEGMTYSLFSNRPAKLQISLKEYQISNFDRDFTLSLKVGMKAQSDLGKPLVDKEFSCTADHFGGPKDLISMVKNAQHHPETFTPSGWRVKIERKLLEQCVQQVMTSFSRAVVRGTPAQGG